MSGPYTRLSLEQGSSEWQLWRQTKIGASDAAAIMGENPWKSRARLLKEKLALSPAFTGNAATRRGTQLEPVARQLYETQTGLRLEPAVLIHVDRTWQVASVDGITATGSKVVEIKCGEKAYSFLYRTGSPPDYYYAQLQHILAVTGLLSIDYFAYLPGYRAITQEIIRDDEYIESLIQYESEFWSELNDALRQRRSPNTTVSTIATSLSSSTLTYKDGSKYEGELRDGRPHGLGKLLFAGGRHYSGGFIEGELAGTGKMTYSDGGFLEGRWDPPGVLQSGTLRFSSGDEYDGSFSNGLWHGHGRYRWAGGSTYSGEWKEGKIHGFGVYDWPGGSHFEGNWEAGLRAGYGKMTWQNGDTYEGYWESGKRAGNGTMTCANGQIFKGRFSDDTPIYGEIIFSNGDRFFGALAADASGESSRFTLASGSYYEGKWTEAGPELTGIVHHESSDPFYLELLKATLQLEKIRMTDWKRQAAQWNGYLLQKTFFSVTEGKDIKIATARARFLRDADKAICSLENSIEETECDLSQLIQIADLLSSSPAERAELFESLLHQSLLLRSRTLHDAALAEIRQATAEFKKLFGTSPWALLGESP